MRDISKLSEKEAVEILNDQQAFVTNIDYYGMILIVNGIRYKVDLRWED